MFSREIRDTAALQAQQRLPRMTFRHAGNALRSTILRWHWFAIRAFFFWAVLSVGRSAEAQPAPTPEEVQQAQARWNEGKAYFDAGNFEAARVAFRQAYTVFPHSAFLQNLGEAELRTGRNVEAARHFAAFLRAASSGSVSQRELAKKSLAKASERLGSLTVTANVDDAEIRIDDEVVGRSPLGSLAWYVEPGRHTVTARRDGFLEGSERVDVPAGPPRSVMIRLQKLIHGGEAAADEAKTPAVAPATQTQPGNAPPSTATAPRPVSTSTSTSLDSHTSGGIPARTIVLISGAVLTVGGAVLGAVYASRANDDAKNLRDVQNHSSDYDPDPTAVCEPPVTNPARQEFCGRLSSAVNQQRDDRRVRDIAFVSAGVVGLATLATVFLWRPRSSDMGISAELGPKSSGVVVYGRF